jgi:anti-anti-sigma factor
MATLNRIEQDGVTIVRLNGSLASEGLDDVQQSFDALFQQHPGNRWVVDVTGVDMVTTPALSMFLSAAHQAKETGGKVVFTEASPPVRDVLRRLRLNTVLTTVRGVEAAIRAVRNV